MTAGGFRLVAAKELRETLRDRRTILVMVLFPLVIYPLLSLLVAQVQSAKEVKQAARASRVAVEGGGEAAVELRAAMAADPATFALVQGAGADGVATQVLDALVSIRLTAPGKPTEIQIAYDQTRDESRMARDRLEELVTKRASPGCTPRFVVADRSVATHGQVGGYLLSKVLPLIVMMMVLLGAFYPAIDVTAGEQERGTLETILSAPIDRTDLMAGKVLAVAVLAALTGVLNLSSISLTLSEGLRLVGAQQNIVVPWSRVASVLLVVGPAALFFASLLVAVGSLARSFKEAQNLFTPVYFLCFTPAIVGTVGDYPLHGPAAFVPGLNLTLLARDLTLGKASAGWLLVVVGSTLLYAAAALVLAARLYDSENMLYAADRQLSLRSWVGRLLLGVRPGEGAPAGGPAPPVTAGQALGLFAVGYALVYFVFVRLQAWDLVRGHLVTQASLLVLVALLARATGRRLTETIRLRRPAAGALLGATLLGLSSWIVLGLLVEWFLPVPRELTERLRRTLAPVGGGRSLAATVALMALLPAVCEESFFRGPILSGLASRLPRPAAVVTTGLLFALFHVDVWRLLPTGLLGILLSWVTIASGSIVPSMLLHFVNNGCLVVVAQLGVDDTLGQLSRPVQLALFGAAAGAVALGLVLVHRSERRLSQQAGGPGKM